ncbi:recombinase family protein [Defluviimonas sp. WL0024]|uniref:Recombinase family protein n=1 Tax=Albidovulum salinarum TaxID=2984153 RepID=A0ABT2X9A5_9RHOB|nr:recombinase family protein [Defluviimonas sp. WL0024]MCU9850339.1 recombinase family protein [Defluviimonas sp. WL0024]
MSEQFLDDLADKTRRGLKGRAVRGKSAGGNAYGYTVLRRFTEAGDPIRGDREINAREAAIVRRIFAAYASGVSPRKIAEELNEERVPEPRGGPWGTSTIHGNRERGTGILNNELYIGRLVWNRLHYLKDPDTGRRVSRPKAEDELVVSEVPQLRIVDDPLWQAVKRRQGKLVSKGTGVPVWDRRRPRTLFSGLMECGCCGAGFSKVSKDSFGCSAARNKGRAICTNRTVIRQTDLEARVLDALQHHLMDEEALRVFCEEYAAERNRLAEAASAGRAGLERELRQVATDHRKLVDAIIAGVPADQVKDRMIELDQRRKDLERHLAVAPAPDPLRYHPSMAQAYRARVGALVRGLTDPDGMEEAKEALRGLIEKIVLVPMASPEGGTALGIDLHGALASLLRLASGLPALAGANAGGSAAADSQDIDISEELVLVAEGKQPPLSTNNQVPLVVEILSLKGPQRGLSSCRATSAF